MHRGSLLAALVLLFGCAAAPPPPPPAGLVEEELARIPDPVGAVSARVAALGPLVAAREEDPEAERNLFRLAWETAGLLSRQEFETVPVLAGRLRTQAFFTARGTDEERASAVTECNRLLRAIKEKLGADAGVRADE
jgi:hypothetical protein